mgnify:CR=1 FL=1
MSESENRRHRIAQLKTLLSERIVILDGAMGTMVQPHLIRDI